MAFRKKVKIYFDQGDPARIAFHGEHSIIVQRVLEEYIPSIGISWEDWFSNNEVFMPIVKLNNEYKKPLYPGKEYIVELNLTHVGKSSVGCGYRILTLEEEACCIVEAVYVCVDKTSFKSKALPKKWQTILKENQTPSSKVN